VLWAAREGVPRIIIEGTDTAVEIVLCIAFRKGQGSTSLSKMMVLIPRIVDVDGFDVLNLDIDALHFKHVYIIADVSIFVYLLFFSL
jgi:hypothetical protein